MKVQAVAITFLGCVCLAWPKPIAARPWRVDQIPNGRVASCLTCHVFPGGPRNAFGRTIEEYGGAGFLLNGDVQWGVAIAEFPGAPPKTLAQIDSDGDGRTSGDELLDPNDAWRSPDAHPGNPALVRLPAVADAAVVIRQLYVTGGLDGALYTNDFVELFNRSDAAVAIGGWSIQYAPPTGSETWGSSPSTITVLPSPLTLQAGGSYLVKEAAGGLVGAALPQVDLLGEIALGDSGGKVALVNDSVPLACNGQPTTCTPQALAKIVDLVGYGNANYFEGLGAAITPPSAYAITRFRSGCMDINHSGKSTVFPNLPVDFALGPPTPRNSSSPPAVCTSVLAVPALQLAWLWMLGAGLALVGVSAVSQARFGHIRNS